MPGWYFPVAADADFHDDFGYRRTPEQIQSGRSPVHQGIDIYGSLGSTLVSPIGGTVVAAGSSNISGWYVQIQGDDGIRYFMAHMMTRPMVQTGQRVGGGQVVGQMGNTGNARGGPVHVHFEMRTSSGIINPYSYLNSGFHLAGGNPPGGGNLPLPEEDQLARDLGRQTPNEMIDQGQLEYVSPDQVVQNAFGADLGDASPLMDTATLLGHVLSSVSDSYAGGTRTDYRGLGRANVPLAQVQAARAGATTAQQLDVPAEGVTDGRPAEGGPV